MPIYEYSCLSCGQNFEKLVRRPDENVQCPQCAATEVRKRLSLFGFKTTPLPGSRSSSSSTSSCASCSATSCSNCSCS